MVNSDRVTLIPECAECQVRWLPAHEERWRAYSQATISTNQRSSSSTLRVSESPESVAVPQHLAEAAAAQRHA